MAITLGSNKISINLGNLVANAVNAVKAVRSTEQSRKESEFQKAVAGGMSYAAQIEFRKKQLEDARSSDFNDEDYTLQLEGAIATTQKLARFESIRIKYKASLEDYITGKSSNESYMNILEGILETDKTPEMQAEVSKLLSDARVEQSTIEINAIKNRSVVAQKDKSQLLIESSIKEIQAKRSLAIINKNEAEVAQWDDTLLALNSSRSKLQIENGLNEISFQSNRSNLKSNDKLGLLNNYISGSNETSPVTYDGVTYPSLKAYWENKRGEYIQNNYFNDVKKELDAETAKIAATSQYGQVPVPRIDAVSKFYSDLTARPEFAPYKEIIEQQRVTTVNALVTDLADSIYNEADATGNKSKAQTAIQTVENKFGVKVAREPFANETADIAGTATKEAAALAAADKTKTPAAGAGGYTVQAGDTLSAIASKNKMTLQSLLDLNPSFKANPSAIKPGQSVVLGAPTPAVTPVIDTKSAATPDIGKPATPPPAVTPPSDTNKTPTGVGKYKSTTQPAIPAVAPAPAANTPPAKKVYVVKPGDTLSSIALRELGDQSKAFDLKTDTGQGYDASTAGKLKIGTKLVIPN